MLFAGVSTVGANCEFSFIGALHEGVSFLVLIGTPATKPVAFNLGFAERDARSRPAAASIIMPLP